MGYSKVSSANGSSSSSGSRTRSDLFHLFTFSPFHSFTGHEVTCFNNDLADELAATIAPLNVSYEATIEAVVVAETAKQSQVATKQSQRQELMTRLASIETYLRAVDGARSFWEICGFNYPKPRATVVANAPSNLSATGASNGSNVLEFVGNNKPGTVVYEVWRRHGDTADWGQIDTIGRQYYVDAPVTPGQYYEYKVRAVAAKNKSLFSNTAVVYGAP